MVRTSLSPNVTLARNLPGLFLFLISTAAVAAPGGFGNQFESDVIGDPRFDKLEGGGTAVAYVGSGPDCDFADLQTALDDAPDDAELRLQNETFSGNFGINNKNLTLVGGFEDCSTESPGFSSTLDGTGNGGNTVLDIFDSGNTGGSWTVELENLTITGGDESSPFERGGGLHVEDDFWVMLTDVTIQNNQSETAGGGVQVTGSTGTLLFIFGSTIIQNNQAGDGGGIACIGPQDQLGVIIDAGAIAFNSASRGGGIFAENCLVASHAGGFLQGIFGNEATSSGGGIAALGGSEIGLIGASPGFLVDGDPDTAAILASNSTDKGGGGAWLLEGSSMEAIDARIVDNSADTRGGGIDIGSDSTFSMGRSDGGSDCGGFLGGASLVRCSSLANNFAGFVGGALATSNSSSAATVTQTFISGNSAGLNASIAELTAGTVRMEGNVIRDNPGNQLVRQFGASEFELAWSTLSDNTPDSGEPPLVEIRASSGPATVTRLYSNIVWNPGRDVVDVDTSSGSSFDLSADCVVSHELGSLDQGDTTRSVIADPLFRDPDSDDYRIAHDSPAVDFCDDANAPAENDLEDQPRGIVVTDPATPYDSGADESRGIVFSDGFES